MLQLVGYFPQQSVVNCGAGEGWKVQVRTIVGKMKNYYIKSRRKGESTYNKMKEGWMGWSLLV
jgi:hypothetical protein